MTTVEPRGVRVETDVMVVRMEVGRVEDTSSVERRDKKKKIRVASRIYAALQCTPAGECLIIYIFSCRSDVVEDKRVRGIV